MHAAPVVHSAPFFTVPQEHFPVQIIHSAPASVVHSAPVPVIHSVPTPVAIPSIPSSQFHAQDEFGQHSFGYQNENSARVESKDALGVTRGSYQYVDANGVLQTTTYIADPINGFRVAATNIPVAVANPAVAIQEAVMETPEVAAARAEHLAAHAEAVATHALAERKRRNAEPIEATYGLPSAPVLVHSVPTQFVHAAPFLQSAPLVHATQPVSFFHNAPAPLIHSAPAPIQVVQSAPIHSVSSPVIVSAPAPFSTPVALPSIPSSQFHAQDEFGQHSFGYQNENSARAESKDAFGVTRGSYQYVDANGVLQTTTYIADPVNGFRVAATNIPVAVANPAVAIQEAVMETPEVAAARAEHLAAHAEAIAQGAAEA